MNLRIVATTPTRIDLAGGTLDIWPLYTLHPGCTINMAIELRARVALKPVDDPEVRIRSIDQSEELRVDVRQMQRVAALPLVREVAMHFWNRKSRGFELETICESPAGAGLGGSSALNVALCGVFARCVRKQYSSEEIVTAAKNIEARILGVPTGTQDYWSALRGGLNVIRLGTSGEHPDRLRVDSWQLAERLVLIYSGTSRNSGLNNWDVMRRRIDGDAGVTSALSSIAEASVSMAESLERADWKGFVAAMRREWEARATLSPDILTPNLQRAIDVARGSAAAWKVCGAGGGGCMVFACDAAKRPRLRKRLAEAGFRVLDVQPASRGLTVRRSSAH